MTRDSGHRPSGEGIPRLPYLPALDGLRGLAVTAVLLYHANLAWIPGGFLGVEVFFVISGYLITSLLLAEWFEQGQLDLKGFWLRRARRLFPALLTLLLVVTGYVVLFLPSEVAMLRGDALSTAGYVNNWYQIFSYQSYFETVGRPPLLRHMWSLAVEEQFYLVWPPLFMLLMRRLCPRQVWGIVLVGAVVSLLAMAWMYQPNTDPSRVYYGTDTRAGGLLLGAALAFVWPPGRVTLDAHHRVLDVIGLAAFGTLSACGLLINEFEAFVYRGGLCLTGLATVELLAVAVHPQARCVPRALGWGPLRWVGLRSYGIYLWHFPVFMVTRPQLDVPIDGVLLLFVRLALTLGIAALSYRWVETPIRQGLLGRCWNAWRQASGREKCRWGLRWAPLCMPVMVAGSILGVLLVTAPPPALPAYLSLPAAAHVATHTSAVVSTNSALPAPAILLPPTQDLALADSPSSPRLLPGTNVPVPALVPMAALPRMPATELTNGAGITAIGDSVMAGVADELRHVLGTKIIVDADRGRLPWNLPAIVRDLRAAGKLHSTVILHVGNNGTSVPKSSPKS